MGRLIITFALIIGLIVLAFFEQKVFDNVYSKLDRDLSALTSTMESQDHVNTTDNKEKINNMYKYWLKKEKSLSLVARHFDLAQISDAIIYVKNFIEHDDKKEAFAGAQRLQYLIDTHTYNMGTSFQNVL